MSARHVRRLCRHPRRCRMAKLRHHFSHTATPQGPRTCITLKRYSPACASLVCTAKPWTTSFAPFLVWNVRLCIKCAISTSVTDRSRTPVREPRKCEGLADVQNLFPVDPVPEQGVFRRISWRSVCGSQWHWWDVGIEVSCIFWAQQIRAIWCRIAVYIFPVYSSEPGMRLDCIYIINTADHRPWQDEATASCVNGEGIWARYRCWSLTSKAILRLAKELLHQIHALTRDTRARWELEGLLPVQNLLTGDMPGVANERGISIQAFKHDNA